MAYRLKLAKYNLESLYSGKCQLNSAVIGHVIISKYLLGYKLRVCYAIKFCKAQRALWKI
jgi:hypothetical protein